ncbi:MAG: nucleotidyl transferase AbiEii/AbiGii toxin family protein [Spirochaetota bacterium]|nr:nucleotidyl transferase AbiEii/AbiGii toxin family protein [Spirochaetota bacterium]
MSIDLFQRFLQCIQALNDEHVEYVLIGGYAILLYGMPRITQDIDFFINPEVENIEKLKRALKKVFNDASIDEISLDMVHEYQVIRYGTPDGFYIDIIAMIGEMYKYSDIQYVTKEIEGITVRVAQIETLYKMKKDTVRPVDKLDAMFLSELLKKKKGEQN